MTTQETIDQAERVIYDALSGQYGDFSMPTDAAQALADAGLLSQPDGAALIDQLNDECAALECDLDQARETIARLNRRAQLAEAALHKQLHHPNGAQDPTVEALAERVRELEAAPHGTPEYWHERMTTHMHRAERAEATIQRVRDLHQLHPANCSCHARRWDGSCFYAGTCDSCHCGMPCPTIRALGQEATK